MPKRKIQRGLLAHRPEKEKDDWDPFVGGINPYIKANASEDLLLKLGVECAGRTLLRVLNKMQEISERDGIYYEDWPRFYELARRMVLQTTDCDRRVVLAVGQMFVQPRSPSFSWYFSSYGGWEAVKKMAAYDPLKKEPIPLSDVCFLFPLAQHFDQFPTAEDVFTYSTKDENAFSIKYSLNYVSRAVFIWDEFDCSPRDPRYSFVSMVDLFGRLHCSHPDESALELLNRLLHRSRISNGAIIFNWLRRAVERQFIECAYWTGPIDPTWSVQTGSEYAASARYMTDHTEIWTTMTGWHLLRLKLQNAVLDSLQLPTVLGILICEYLGVHKLPDPLFNMPIEEEFERKLRGHLLQLRVMPGPLYLPPVKSNSLY